MENERQPWIVRDDDEDYDAQTVDDTYTNLFSIKVNHGGSFTPKGGREYVLDYGLVALGSDQDVKELLKYVVRNKVIE
nr:hypothetical protein [Tanacetum cinerariifolium]